MATKSNRNNLGLKVFLFGLVAALTCLSYLFLQFLITNSIYPGEILERDYTETTLYRQHEVHERVQKLLRSNEEVYVQEDGVYFYYYDGTNVYTNVADPSIAFFQSAGKHFYAYVDERFWAPQHERYPQSYLDAVPGQAYMLSFSDEFVAGLQEKWDSLRRSVFWQVMGVTLSLLAALLVFIRLIYLLSNKPNSYMRQLDWIPLELLLIAVVLLVIFMSYLLANSLHPSVYDDFLNVITGTALVGLYTLTFELVILMIVSRLKREELAETSLLRRVFSAIGIVLSTLTGRSKRLTDIVARRTAIFLLTLFLLVALIYQTPYQPLTLGMGLITLGMVTWFIRANNKTLSSIDQSMDRSVQEMLKSEKTKVELITNVSHDLKTPLTSIISYVDLLKHEPLEPTALEYVEVIENKSNRLNQILQDVFELSKATTGAVEVDRTELDLRRLIRQTVIDMDSQIEKSGHTLKLHLPDYAVMIESDGARLYRVLQNIIDNALKYTHPGTRIFLDLTIEGQQAVVVLKNTSAYAMDFTSENVLQRFYRADMARSSEGSGLGLSIAESFTELSGGTFDIEIEGDLFKVVLSFPVSSMKGFS